MLHLLLLTSVMGPAPTSPPESPESEAPGGQAEITADTSAVVDVAFALVGDWAELSPEALEPALSASLVDLGIEVSVTKRPLENVFVQLDWARKLRAEQQGRAVFWLVRLDPNTVQLFVLPPGTDLGYVRDIAFAEGADELAESLAVIVRGAAESLGAGAPSGMRSLEPKPEPEPQPEPEPEPKPELEPAPVTVGPAAGPRVRVGLSYLGASLASNAPWQSGAALDIGVRFPMHLTAAITAGWSAGQARDELTDLRLNRVPLGLAVGYAFNPQPTVTGRIMATGVAELMWWQPETRTSLSSGSDVRVGLGLRADLVVHLHRGLGLVVSAAGVGWLRNVRVDVEELGVARTVLGPGPIGAEARAGLQYEF